MKARPADRALSFQPRARFAGLGHLVKIPRAEEKAMLQCELMERFIGARLFFDFQHKELPNEGGHILFAGCTAILLSGTAFAGPCTTANKEAGSGRRQGRRRRRRPQALPDRAMRPTPPTSSMNKASDNVATSSQDAQRDSRASRQPGRKPRELKPKQATIANLERHRQGLREPLSAPLDGSLHATAGQCSFHRYPLVNHAIRPVAA